MNLRKCLSVPLILAAISTQLSCGTESPTQESSLTATTQEASALKAIQDVLNGADITATLSQVSLPADLQAAVWDFYKAQAGVDWKQGVRVNIQGAERRQWVRAGQVHAAALLESARKKAEGQAIQKSIQMLYLKSFKEQMGLTYQAPVYSYVKLSNEELDKITGVLHKVPANQREYIAPIFIVENFPGTRSTGGGYYTPEEVKQWLGKAARTAVPDQDIQDFVLSSGHGIVAISRTALLKPDIHPYTILHEVAHSIDHFIQIVPAGATVEQFRGIRYPKKIASEYATEAYARFMINRNRICRDDELPEGESQVQCSKRIMNELNKAPAFRKSPLK